MTGESLLTAVPGRTIVRQVLRLAGPVLVEQTMLYLVGFSDTLLTGRFLAVTDLAAVTVSSYMLWFLGSLMMVASAGGTALVARLTGANDRAGANRMAAQALFIGFVAGTTILVVGEAFAPTIVRGLGLTGAAADAAAVYLRVILAIFPLLAAEIVGVACLRGAGDTRTGMMVVIAINVINVALSWLFVTGPGPVPRLGVAGVALGTAVGEGVGGLIVLTLLARGRSGLRIRLANLAPRPDDLRRLLRISLPAAGESGTNGLCQLAFLSLINVLGPTVTAAHGVAIRVEAIAFLGVTAFAVAASTLTGQYLGAGRPDLAARAARTAWGLGALMLGLLGVILFLLARPLFELFLGTGRDEVVALGVPVLRLVSLALPLLATINVLTGALRGAGDTRIPWLIVLVGYLLIRLPLTVWLTRPETAGGPGLGLWGAWLAMAADLAVRSAMVAARFLHGGWKRVRV
jgi:putative MATE family efflux protein